LAGGTTTNCTYLVDLRLRQSLLVQPLAGDELVVRAQGVDRHLLADQIAGGGDGRILAHVITTERQLVGAVGAEHRGDFRAAGDQLHHRAVERAAELGLIRRRRLDTRRTTGGVTLPFQGDLAEIAEIIGEFERGDLAGGALIAQDGLAVGGGGGAGLAAGTEGGQGPRGGERDGGGPGEAPRECGSGHTISFGGHAGCVAANRNSGETTDELAPVARMRRFSDRYRAERA